MKVTITLPTGLSEMAPDMVKATQAAASRGLKQGVQIVVGALREASGDGILKRRTGQLAGSWKGGAVESADYGFVAKIGSNMAYAGIQNDGGTIYPVKAKALTIPFAENLTARGVPRYESVAALKAHFGEKNVFTMKGKNIIWAKTGKSSRSLKPFFVLAKKSVIKPTHYIDKTLAAESDTVRERIGTEIAVAQIMAGRDGK